MPQTLVIQTAAMMERRMVDQLRRRRVDVGLYFGEELMAGAWKAYDQKYQSTSDIANGPTRNRYGGERCVVDLGPGSGKPCLAAITAYIDHIDEIVVVDVSKRCFLWRGIICKGTAERSFPLSSRTSFKTQKHCTRL